MAQVTDTTDPAAGFQGILMPNIQYFFRVEFLDADKNVLPFSEDLSRCIIKLGEITDHTDFSRHGLIGTFTRAVKLTLEDDRSNKAVSAIKALRALILANRVIMAVHYGDGDGDNGTTRTVFVEVHSVPSVTFSRLDYTGQSTRTTSSSINFNRIGKQDLEQLQENPTINALLTLLKFATLDTAKFTDIVSTIDLELDYSSVEVECF